MDIKPPVTGTTHALPFDKLDPMEFERLCLWLVGREGYSRGEHLGAAGSEQGRDVLAWKDGECWAFQCKRYKVFGAADAFKEIEKIASLPGDQLPFGVVFVVTSNVRAKAREQARIRCKEAHLACEFWAGTELDEKVKRHPDIVAEFFQLRVKPEQVPTGEGEPHLTFAPTLPNNYVERQLLSELKTMVLTTARRTVGVWGLPGTGKSVLVCGLIHSYVDELKDTFPGGVYWVYGTGDATSGEPRTHCQSQLYAQLPGTNSDGFIDQTWEIGLRTLQKAFAESRVGGKRWLVVVDNVPDGVDVLPALQLSDSGLLLVITNNRELLVAQGIPNESILEVRQMESGEAQELLTRWLAGTPSAAIESAVAAEVAKRLGYHPLALAMAGAGVRGAISPQNAWQDMLDALKAEELDEISRPVDDYPVRQLPLIFKVVIDALPADLQMIFPDLAVFPQDSRLALQDLYRLWAPQAERRIRRHVQHLLDRSLLQSVHQDTFALHSLLRLYLRHTAEDLARRCRQVVSILYPGFPPIFVAAEWNDLQEVKAFVQEGEDVNAVAPNGASALHVAAELGYDEIVSALADAGSDLERAIAGGHTALKIASQNGRVDTVRVLLDHAADPNTQDNEGSTPLHIAAQNDHLNVVSLLLSRNAQANLANQGDTSALYVAIGAGNTQIVQALLQHTTLAELETDPEETPLRMASRRGNVEIMRLLIDAGADINWANPSDGGTALHIASLHGQAAAAEILIHAGARQDSRSHDGFAPLHLAAQGGHSDVVKALIEAGAIVDQLNAAQCSPLHLAVAAFDLDTVDALLMAGADVDRRQVDGWAPLHLSICFRVAKLRDARYSGTMSIDETGFHMASAVAQDWIIPPIVKRLIEAHADVDLPGENGMTPLHVAASLDDAESARALLAAGARPDLRDDAGKTPLDIGRKNHQPKVMALLEQA